MKPYNFLSTYCILVTCILQSSQLSQQAMQQQAQERPTRQATELETKMVNEAVSGTLTKERLHEYLKQGANINVEAVNNFKTIRNPLSFGLWLFSHQTTALVGAGLAGHGTIVSMLLEAGANLNQKDEDGASPIQRAVIENKPEFVRILIKARASLDDALLVAQGRLISSSSFADEDVNILKQLVLAGVNVNLQDENGQTTLILLTKHACREIANSLLIVNIRNEIDMIQALLRTGAQLEIQDREGKTAEDYARCNSRLQKVFKDYRQEKNLQKKILLEGKSEGLIEHEEDVSETQSLLPSVSQIQSKSNRYGTFKEKS